jgi:C-terminal processing protease CtpA/Prc
MLATYDPHSNYYPPIDAMELNRQTTLQLKELGYRFVLNVAMKITPKLKPL